MSRRSLRISADPRLASREGDDMRSSDRSGRAPVALLSAIAVMAVGLVAAGLALAADPIDPPVTTWTGQGTVNGDGQELNTIQCDADNPPGSLQWNLTAKADTARISFDGGTTWQNMGPPTGGVFKYVSGYLLPLDPTDALVKGDWSPVEDTNVQLTISHGCPGELPPADAVTATKTAEGSFDRTYAWEISKDVDKTTVTDEVGEKATFNYTVTVEHDAGTDSGWLVAGEISVTNPNDAVVEDVDVSDAIAGDAACTVTGGDDDGVDETIPALGGVTFDYTCTYNTKPEGTDTNTATVAWPDQDLANATHLDAGSVQPTADVNWDTVTADPIDECVDVDDTLDIGSPESLGTVCVGDPTNPTEFKFSKEFDVVLGCVKHDNTATFTTTDDENDTDATGSDTATVTVCGYIPPTADKTAVGSFDRTYEWDIAKDVDKTKVTGEVGGKATFNYTVTVSHDAGTDSNGAVSGTINVSNDNGVNVTVDVGDSFQGADCIVNGGDDEDLVIPAGGKSFDYTCTASDTEGTDTNTATVSWDEQTLANDVKLPADSATGTANVNWAEVDPNEIDDCVEVTDVVDATPPAAVLGTVCLDDANPTELKFSKEFNVVTGCVDHNNTATFTTDDTGATGDDTVIVTVCGVFHGKTMGYWGNTNGQARLAANDAFSATNAVTLGASPGCYVVVDSATKSKKILPNTLNGISILTNCTAANQLDSGINANSMNTLLAQTLAISYNIKYVNGYTGQTISALGWVEGSEILRSLPFSDSFVLILILDYRFDYYFPLNS